MALQHKKGNGKGKGKVAALPGQAKATRVGRVKRRAAAGEQGVAKAGERRRGGGRLR